MQLAAVELAPPPQEHRLMAVLPARPAFTLDTLVARARAAASSPKRRSAAPQSRPAPRPLGELERDASLTAHDPSALLYATRETAAPVALALWITVATCACGRVYRLPPHYALAKYTATAHSVHYSRADADALGDLPRELREKAITIPFCEECFGGTPELRSNLPTSSAEEPAQ